MRDPGASLLFSLPICVDLKVVPCSAPAGDALCYNAALRKRGNPVKDDQQVIIVGVAQATWREHDVERTPIDALANIAAAALEDVATTGIRDAIDTIVHVPFVSDNVPALVAAMPRNPGVPVAGRLGITAKHFRGDSGGNLPQYLASECAARLRRGESEVAMIMGVELLATFRAALRGGAGFPPWGSGVDDTAEALTTTPPMTSDTEVAHGLFEPSHSYALVESALRHACQLSAGEQGARNAAIIADMSAVAAENPYAARRERLTPGQVLSTEQGNRMIASPYTKLMCAHIGVDQAAAVIMTTVSKAKALGIAPERWVYLRGAADCNEVWHLSERERLHESPAIRIAAGEALRQARLGLGDLGFFDIYSCFPSAVQVACDAIGLDLDDPRGLTVTGGLPLFGGPGNNYSLHAIASLVDRLRGTADGAGLVTANGGYLTKHSVGVYSRLPGGDVEPRGREELQREIDALPRLEVASEGRGAFTIDAHTVSFGRAGPKNAIALGRLDDDRRCVAVSDDTTVIEAFLARDCVGETGQLEHAEGINRLRL
jgi:acetyl-CoA C-acetyltransferase